MSLSSLEFEIQLRDIYNKKWSPNPINIWVGNLPYNNAQTNFFYDFKRSLESYGCIFVSNPNEETSLGIGANLVIGFGKNEEEEINPLYLFGRLPKPRGTALIISCIGEELSEDNLFWTTRCQLIRKATQIGIFLETDKTDDGFTGILWASMVGNYHKFSNGISQDTLNALVLRVLAHAGSHRVHSHHSDVDAAFSWTEWSLSPIQKEIAAASILLGAAGIVEDSVSIDSYASSKQARRILHFLEKGALGEGMRSQLDPDLRVMGVTVTGGGKVDVSPNPQLGHIVPVGKLTKDGFVRLIPKNCPIAYNAPSVETHENGMVYLASALLNSGVVRGFMDFLLFITDHFSKSPTIDILPTGLDAKALAIEHFHHQPVHGIPYMDDYYEVVYPDDTVFPSIDFPCGTVEAEIQLLSALFKSKAFTQKGPLDKVIIAVLPGHGSVAVYGGQRSKLTDCLINKIKMEMPQRV